MLAFTMKDIDGKDVDLRQYLGQALLLVNTASRCIYTPQYAHLQELHDRHAARGFSVLGFPSNDFDNQEPGSNGEIKKFCLGTLRVSFPMFAKVHVIGPDICPLYQHLTAKDVPPKFAGDIAWNFTKFLVDRSGTVVGRFRSADDPLHCTELQDALAAILGEAAPGSSVCHFEIISRDPPRTRAFLEQAFGWRFDSVPHMTGYEFIDAGSLPGGGLRPLEPGDHAPHVLNYLRVDDVDAALARVLAAGGRVVQPRRDVPRYGSFAVFEAPGGVLLALWQRTAPV